MRLRIIYLLFVIPMLAQAQGMDTLKREFVFYRDKSSFLLQDSLHLLSFADTIKRMRYNSVALEGYPDEIGGDNNRNYALTMSREISAYSVLQTKGINKNITYRSISGKKRHNNTRCVILYVAVPKPSFDKMAFQVGNTIVLKTVQFNPGKDILLPSAYPALKELSDFLRVKPKMELEIDGHVCCNDDSTLAEKRAYVVYKKLIDQGVTAKRLSYKGMGTRFKIADEKTEAGKMANRRVEIKVLKDE